MTKSGCVLGIRDQVVKLRKFWSFGPSIFWGVSKFLTEFRKSGSPMNMWQKLVTIDREISDIRRWEKKDKRRAVTAQTTWSRCKVLSIPYSTFIIIGLTKGKWLYMASESLLSCISPFFRHLRNHWPWISLKGHSRSYILTAIESQCATLYRPLIVAFALSSTFSEILPALYARANCVSK